MAQIDTISKAEAVKQQSRQLRGHIAPRLRRRRGPPSTRRGIRCSNSTAFTRATTATPRPSASSAATKSSGSSWCACAFRAAGSPPSSISGSTRSPARYADGSLRITTRQSIQFHGVVKSGLKSAIAEVNAALMTTLAACGDVVRTVTTVPAPIRDPVHDRLEADAGGCRPDLLPQTGAYHEIWVDGEKWREDQAPASRPTRSTASAICRANSRSASPCPRTTRSTC